MYLHMHIEETGIVLTETSYIWCDVSPLKCRSWGNYIETDSSGAK